MRKSFLKIGTPTILEFVRKIVICGSSHILGIEITTFFRKMNHGFPYVELTLKYRFVRVPTDSVSS
ncbi:hypothetical protein LMANV2_20071 [Leptospira interrogans serovar Manilae]|uniref:Uncharacterized protein n=1 Tax=Leptospira interrogans serovar Manilae TaxID=214675 RepID=A0AAQ1NWK5_LEPIR|nr:hypothetical protein CI00_10475 [Leptospira interrogans serovar Manilae]SOR60716.1 hypothetical protein LMANV2_20071 [Leptospira interrogans serovar Manilae]